MSSESTAPKYATLQEASDWLAENGIKRAGKQLIEKAERDAHEYRATKTPAPLMVMCQDGVKAPTRLTKWIEDYETWTPWEASMLVNGLDPGRPGERTYSESTYSPSGPPSAAGLCGQRLMGDHHFREVRRVEEMWRRAHPGQEAVVPADFVAWCALKSIDTAWLKGVEFNRRSPRPPFRHVAGFFNEGRLKTVALIELARLLAGSDPSGRDQGGNEVPDTPEVQGWLCKIERLAADLEQYHADGTPWEPRSETDAVRRLVGCITLADARLLVGRIAPGRELPELGKDEDGPGIPHQAEHGVEDPGPRLKKKALIERYKRKWLTIEGDLRDASENGLASARASHGYYYEKKAVEWAIERGKMALEDGGAHLHSMWPGVVTTHKLGD